MSLHVDPSTKWCVYGVTDNLAKETARLLPIVVIVGGAVAPINTLCRNRSCYVHRILLRKP